MELQLLMILKFMKGHFKSIIYILHSTRNPFQKFILPNTGIDLDTLVVSVRPSVDSSVSTKYDKTR